MTDYEARYEVLAQTVGVAALRELVLSRVSAERVAAALAAGDEHLNGILLGIWDALALGGAEEPRRCGACGQQLSRLTATAEWPYEQLRATMRRKPWSRWPGPQSLAERVCLLKHVAVFHLGGGGGRGDASS